MTKLSIIIVNYNTFLLTSNCIRTVLKQTQGKNYEIILVDNASTELDPRQFLIEFPGIKLIRSQTNGGFAYGNNLGIANSSGEYILLLNNDTLLHEDAITKSLEYFESRPGTGVVGCRMTYEDGKVQYSARRFRSIGWELLDLFRFIPYLMPYPKRSRLMLGKYFRHDREMEVDWVNGAFFLFRRQLLERFPGKKLDDRFFMYGEDQLWCEQIKILGYSISFFSGASIIHLHSGSSSPDRKLSLRKTMMKHELAIMRLRKGRGLYYFIFKVIYVSKEASRNFIKSITYRITGRPIR